MSLGAIKADGEILKRVGELIRQGSIEEAYALMEQSFGPNSKEALQKAISYNISPERLGELLTKIPLSIDRFEQRLRERGKDEVIAKEIQEQAKAQKAAEEKAAKQAKEAERRFEKRMKEYRDKKRKLDKEGEKLDKKEEKLKRKLNKEKKAEKRRQIEQEIQICRERKRQLNEEKRTLETMRQGIEDAYRRPSAPQRKTPQTTLNPQMMRERNSR